MHVETRRDTNGAIDGETAVTDSDCRADFVYDTSNDNAQYCGACFIYDTSKEDAHCAVAECDVTAVADISRDDAHCAVAECDVTAVAYSTCCVVR